MTVQRARAPTRSNAGAGVIARAALAMREAVSHPIRRIPAGINRKSALQFVVPGSVQEITDRNHPSHSSSKEDQLAGRPTLAKRLCHRVEFPPSIAQVMVGNAKIHGLQRGVAGKKRLVGCVPKFVFSDLGQILSSASTANKEHHEQKMKYPAPSHRPTLRLTRLASQIT
jgi:hypothetical protein